MVSNLADGVERIIPFVRQIQEQALYSDAELMDGIIRKVYDLVLDVADFISGYVCRSAMSTSFNIYRYIYLYLSRKNWKIHYIYRRSKKDYKLGRRLGRISR